MALDAVDPLASLRTEFAIDDASPIYLNGNSLGRLPRASADRLAAVVSDEWGRELGTAWDHWLSLPTEVGDRLGAALLGAGPGQTLICDSVTVNLYKLVAAALAARPAGRDVVLACAEEFPTDRYVLESLAPELVLVEGGFDELREAIDSCAARLALVVVSLVNYRSGELADLSALTDAAHGAGALALWDLSHAVGAVPISLDEHRVDLAVGCTYKYLNAGPGAPAFLYVRRDLITELHTPIQGWFGQRDQFAMGPRYDPQPDIRRFLAGTPSILGITAVGAGIEVFERVSMDAVRVKNLALGQFAIDLCDQLGLAVASPRDPARRGAHVAVAHPAASRLVSLLEARHGVITDFREPDVVRLGFAAPYVSFADVYDALTSLQRAIAEIATD